MDLHHQDAFFLGIAVATLVFFLFIWIAKKLDRRARSRRSKNALVAEELAIELLDHAGFEVIDRQARVDWPVCINDEEVTYEVRADFIAKRGSALWVVEVKSSAREATLRQGRTRRQLLEYQLAFESEGIVLVDMENRHLVEVSFPVLDELLFEN